MRLAKNIKMLFNFPRYYKRIPFLTKRKIIVTLPANLKKVLFSGKAYYCPVCQSHLRIFLAYYHYPKYWCPICGSFPRHRLVWLFFQKKTDLFDQSPKRMLHVAPEPAFASNFREFSNIDYLTADLYNPKAMVKMDITNIQYPDNSFDVIYCSHVLEHVSDDRQAMREFNRVLSPDGWVVFLVPMTSATTFEDPSIISPVERERVSGQSDHVRRYGPDLEVRLEEEGFSVTIVSATEVVDVNDLHYMGLRSSEVIFFCKHRSQ